MAARTVLNWVHSFLRQAGSILYVLYMLKQFFRPDTPMLLLPIHVFATIGLLFLWKPVSPNMKEGALVTAARVFDLLAFAACVYIICHYIRDTARIQNHLQGIHRLAWGDMFAFCVGVPLMLEAVRRTAGMGLVTLLLVFIGYGFFGGYLPGWFKFMSFDLKTFAELTVLGYEGLMGVTASAITSFVFYFILFGAFFSATGGGKVFIDLAMKVTGRQVGGPAKTAIVSSALFGTISGSALANVTATGVLTIPLMKRAGYTPEQAAATEAIASAGGQLMPPIMGVAAFVMADLLGIPYSNIALAGVLPAIAFYFALYVNVDLLARKRRLKNIDAGAESQGEEPVLRRIHLLLAPISLVTTLMLGYSAPMAALVGTAAALIAPFLRRSTWYGVRKFYASVVDVGRQMADVSVAVTAVGIIIMVSIQSSLALKFVTLLAELGRNNLFASLLLVVLGCLILGMGLPTVAAYIIGAIMFVPALRNLGIDRLPAHFFVMFYSVLSQVTPPVALAAFAAAAIAKANPYKTGFIGVGLGMAIFILPFGFIRDQALLWQGEPLKILIAGIGISCATGSWAIALQGWLGGGILRLPVRLVFAVVCFIIVYEPTFSLAWTVCFSVFAVLFVLCKMGTTKKIFQVRAPALPA